MVVRTYPEEYLGGEEEGQPQQVEKQPVESIVRQMPSDDLSKLMLLGIVAVVCISGIVIVYVAKS